MDAAIMEIFVQLIRCERLVMDHLYVSASALLVYDYLLMFPLEIRLVWPSSWNYIKVLYLLVRYIPLASMALVLYSQLFLNVPQEMCRVTWPIAVWTYTIEQILAETLLCIRTWAVWDRNKKVGIGLALMMLANLIAQCVFANRFMKSIIYGSRPYTGYRGCFIEKVGTILWTNYFVATIVQTAVLALIAVSGIRAYRSGHRNKLSDVIHRDGIMFYVYLLCLTVANIFAIRLLPLEYINIFSPHANVLYSVLTSRIILNIRNVSQRNTVEAATELLDYFPENRFTRQTLQRVEFQIYRDVAWSRPEARDDVVVDNNC